MIANLGIIPLMVGLIDPTNAAWDCRIIYMNWEKEHELLSSIKLNVPDKYLDWYPYYSECEAMGYKYTTE